MDYSKKKTAIKAVKYPVLVGAFYSVGIALTAQLTLSSEVTQAVNVLILVGLMAVYDALKHKLGWKLP